MRHLIDPLYIYATRSRVSVANIVGSPKNVEIVEKCPHGFLSDTSKATNVSSLLTVNNGISNVQIFRQSVRKDAPVTTPPLASLSVMQQSEKLRFDYQQKLIGTVCKYAAVVYLEFTTQPRLHIQTEANLDLILNKAQYIM